ncbi:MAG: SDR family NAD(P)-dependent oxidoreductase, partial [Erysipelotrichaceae bacterium]|nr:SDR family NAD(P)-dependent oxidoreductase [Erysipelotrichaceae bacterium]
MNFDLHLWNILYWRNTEMKKNVCVITGGGSGMGLEAAKYMPKDKVIVVAGRTVKKLEKAVEELKSLGYEAYG